MKECVCVCVLCEMSKETDCQNDQLGGIKGVLDGGTGG